jgi:hypothetical protein
MEISHVDGTAWFEAPAPPLDHDCWVQTFGSTDKLPSVERCPCGATRLDGPDRPWIEKNSRWTGAR